jgi:DNA/RNA-binding domain of Phe-tRNA-synthetase-like protein
MSTASGDEYPVVETLAGWELFWATLELDPEGASLGALLQTEVERARRDWSLGSLAEQPAVAALRRLFRTAGCDPTRYRPASEALLRRVLKGGDLPSIHPFVDLNNCLSLRLAVPCCVMAEGTFEGPFILRTGAEGESYESLKGPFNLAAKPLLIDSQGPCDAPITGSRRVMIRPDTRRAALVAYLPAGVVSREETAATLGDLLGRVVGLRSL